MKVLVIGGTRGLGAAVVAAARGIRRADVAEFIVAQLASPQFVRKTVLLTG